MNVAQHQPSKNNFSDADRDAKDAKDANVISLIRKDQRRINFLGAAGHFPTISYVQVINGEYPKDLFRNKIVLVGGTALLGLLFTLFSFAAISLIAVIMPQLAGFWIPPSAALSAILLSYPIWSWRKLDATRKYLDYELSYLKENLIDLPRTKKAKNYDSFDARIEQVRAASQQLRFLQNDRKEMLAFVSHDLRAPIANAMMILEESHHPEHRLHDSLSQALALAEDFLQASRAEMIDSTNFKEIDYANLTHQAVDDAYESSLKKNITLERDILNGMVWVHGNFGLLQRAVLNLILNAVKFSPVDSTVKIRLTFSN